MSFPFSSIVTRLTYVASQLPRVGWYVGYSLVLRALSKAARRREGLKVRRRAHTDAPMPDRSRIYADMAKLFFQHLANVETGIYPSPPTMTEPCLRRSVVLDSSSRTSPKFIDDARVACTTKC